MKLKSYTELCSLDTFDEKLEYLQENQVVGDETFGAYRYVNQAFYKTKAWRSARNDAIVRDRGCEFGMEDYEILGDIIVVHHINPITEDMIAIDSPMLYSLENLITVSDQVHKYIHYGGKEKPTRLCLERKPGDTTLW